MEKQNPMILIGIILACIGVFVPNLIILGGNIGVYISSETLQFIGVLIVLAAYLSMTKIVPSLKSDKKLVINYIIADVGIVGSFGLSVGTLGTDILPWIISLFPVSFVDGVFGISGIIIIPLGSLLMAIGGALCLIGLQRLMFALHFEITGSK